VIGQQATLLGPTPDPQTAAIVIARSLEPPKLGGVHAAQPTS
jgi:hypothetical protein